MKKVIKEEAEIIKNSDTSTLLEYSNKLNEKNLDFCINTIKGRYPENGFCSNLKCQELCYVLEGEGSINKKDEVINFKQGDIIFIDKEEVYYWIGNFKLSIVCNPAWSKEQCKLIEE